MILAYSEKYIINKRKGRYCHLWLICRRCGQLDEFGIDGVVGRLAPRLWELCSECYMYSEDDDDD